MGFAIFGIVVAGSVIYIANMHDVRQTQLQRFSVVNWLLLTLCLLGVALGAYIIWLAVIATTPPTQLTPNLVPIANEYPNLTLLPAIGFFALSTLLGIVGVGLIMSETVRQWVAKNVIRSDGKNRLYNPQSVVHTTAIILAFLETLNVVGGFILVGGIEGLADNIATNGMTFDLLTSGLITNILISLLGVGLFIRRDWHNTLDRLALKTPSVKDVLIGLGVGFLVYWVARNAIVTWSRLIAPEQFAAQTAAAEQLFITFSGSLLAGIILAGTAAIGEEILFRGALQPIFGIFWTSVFFALLHTQYILTPAALVIFTVSLAFGWLRRRYNTTTVIVAHFFYNVIPFLLYWFLTQFPAESLIP